MMCGITGTPGTGKSSVAYELADRGHRVIHAADTVHPYIVGWDEVRQTSIVDEDRWARNFQPFDGFVEGSIAHHLPCNVVVVLRCRPDILAERLTSRGYPARKVRENAEAEALDVILVEVAERYRKEQIHEIDTTFRTVQELADAIEMAAGGRLAPSYGSIDWSAYLVGML